MIDDIETIQNTNAGNCDLLPFVSIVIPVFNGSQTIRLCLDSILQSDYPCDRYEVIVVDNNSTDGTPEIIQQYPVKLLYEHELQGPHVATNTGVRHAKGEIIVFTDADCVAEKSWLRRLVAPLANEEFVAAGGKIDIYQPYSRVEKFFRDQIKPHKNCVRLSETFPAAVLTGNAAYKAEAIRAVGLFNPNLYTGSEVDLAWRVQWQTGKKVIYVADAVVYHKYSSNVRRLFRHFQIYGYSEIILGTIYKDFPGYPRRPVDQLHLMLRQICAIFTYMGSFIYRFIIFLPYRKDIDYILSPVFWFVSEIGNLYGKLEAMWLTRYYRKQFWKKDQR